MLRDRIHELADKVNRIAEEHGAMRIRLVGSVSRGEERPDSDVDFLVAFRPGTSLLDLSGMKLDLEDLLGRKVDLIDESVLVAGLRRRIFSEAAPL
jgi:predicted nucleotidyltransferase